MYSISINNIIGEFYVIGTFISTVSVLLLWCINSTKSIVVLYNGNPQEVASLVLDNNRFVNFVNVIKFIKRVLNWM